MAKQEITFTVTPGGMTVETSGYKGNACEGELKRLREHLKREYGIELTITDDQKKPEYYNVNSGEKSQERI